MTVKFEQHVNRKATPQSEPIPGEQQKPNNAGGYAYEVDKWQRLNRFLILGCESGTYYVREKELARQNAACVEACLAEDALRTIQFIVAVSDTGRAPKNDPAIFALALAASAQNPDAQGLSSAEIRTYALGSLDKVCRIPTHLFHFIAYVKALRGFGRGLRRAVRDWYARWTPEQLAYELVKYQARDGWAHRDVLRQAHARLGADYQAALRWAVRENNEDGKPVLGERHVNRRAANARLASVSYKGVSHAHFYRAAGELPAVIAAFEEAKTTSPQAGVALIRAHNLSREMVPSAWLQHPYVWEALLEEMGPEAMIRNLGKMTSVGLLGPLSDGTKTVVARLGDAELLRRKRIHPLAILNALRVYQQGHGDKGSLTWKAVGKVVDALDAAFYASFRNVAPTGKRVMLALDVSGSMSAHIGGTGLSCREASAALALVTANVESDYIITGFTNGGFTAGKSQWAHMGYSNGISPLDISPRQRLDDVVRYIEGLKFGGTDCALPMLYATKEKLDVDAFCVYTDSETWAGNVHPSQALRQYREKRNKPQAGQVVVGMTATEFTIADPKDPRTLDVVGFDLQTPTAIAEFIRG